MIMDIVVGNSFRSIMPFNSRPCKVYLDKISTALNGKRLFHYSYYNYHGKGWVHGLVDEADFMHMIAVRPRRKRNRSLTKEKARVKAQSKRRK